MTENEKDILLLYKDPNALLLKYQGRIRIMVEQFARSGMVSPASIEDTIQDVNEGLLLRIPIIRRKYDGRSLLVTYFSTIVRNICLQRHKESKMQYQSLGAADIVDPGANRIFSRLAIGEALAGLREVLDLYCSDKARLLILLRVYFKIPLDEKAILRAYPTCSPEPIRMILEKLGSNVAVKEERELFDLAAPFLNAMEGKSTTGGGYHHWLGLQLTEILQLLRARLGVPEFSRDALGRLFETMMLHSEEQK